MVQQLAAYWQHQVCIADEGQHQDTGHDGANVNCDAGFMDKNHAEKFKSLTSHMT